MKRKISLLMSIVIVMLIPLSGCKRVVSGGSVIEYESTYTISGDNSENDTTGTQTGTQTSTDGDTQGSSTNTEVNNKPSKLKNPKISFISWYDPGFTDSTLPIYRAKKRYEELYGKNTINVIITSSADGYKEKLVALLSGNDAPEIVQVKTDWMPSYAIENILQPVDGKIDYKKLPYQGLVNAMTWNGKHYVGNPNGVWSQVIWYNKTLFETYGEKTPMEYYKEGTWTWDNFLKAARNMTSDGVWGFSTRDLNMLVRSQSTNFVKQNSDGSMDITWKSAEVVNALQLTSDMIHKYKCWNPDLTYSTLNFKKGKVAMSSGVIGFIQNFCEGMSDEIDLAPLPKPTANSEHYSASYGIFYGIGAGCDNIDGAVAFLKILAEEEAKSADERTPLERNLTDEQLKIVRNLANNAGILVDLSLPSWYPSEEYNFWNELSTKNTPVATLQDSYQPVLQKAINELLK